MDIHRYERRYEGAKRRLYRSPISERNKKLIADFMDALMLEGISKPRILRYMENLRRFSSRLGKDLDEADLEDLRRVVAEIQQHSTWSPWTKQLHKIMIRRFYRWQAGTEEYPELVRWIKIGFSKSEKKLPSEGDLLTEDEVKKLLDVAEHPRDKAIIAVLWDSGTRIGEFGTLRLRNIAFDQHGAVITVHGKTGSRKVRLIWSVSYLSTWMQNHPLRKDSNSALWINIGWPNHHEPMEYKRFRNVLITLARRAGITKRVNPHSFRHARATFMASHLTEFQMNQYFGWIQGSDMPGTYVHMSGKHCDDAILAMNGLQPLPKKPEEQLRPQKCSKCETINSHEATYCIKCGGAMSVHGLMERQEDENAINRAMNELLKNEAMLKELAQKIVDQGLSKEQQR